MIEFQSCEQCTSAGHIFRNTQIPSSSISQRILNVRFFATLKHLASDEPPFVRVSIILAAAT